MEPLFPVKKIDQMRGQVGRSACLGASNRIGKLGGMGGRQCHHGAVTGSMTLPRRASADGTMRVQQQAAAMPKLGDLVAGFLIRDAGTAEQRSHFRQRSFAKVNVPLPKLIHQRCNSRRIAVIKIKQQALKIGGNGNIHAGR